MSQPVSGAQRRPHHSTRMATLEETLQQIAIAFIRPTVRGEIRQIHGKQNLHCGPDIQRKQTAASPPMRRVGKLRTRKLHPASGDYFSSALPSWRLVVMRLVFRVVRLFLPERGVSTDLPILLLYCCPTGRSAFPQWLWLLRRSSARRRGRARAPLLRILFGFAKQAVSATENVHPVQRSCRILLLFPSSEAPAKSTPGLPRWVFAELHNDLETHSASFR